MRTALIITAGTRGDVEPFLALLSPLVSHFSHVHVLIQPDHVHLVTNPHVTAHALPFSQSDLVKLFLPAFLKTYLFTYLLRVQSFNTSVRRDAITLRNVLSTLVIPSLPYLLSVAKEVKPSVILSSFLTTAVSQTLSEALSVPLVSVSFNPSTRTTLYPFSFVDLDTAKQAAKLIRDMQANNRQYPSKLHAESYDTMIDTLHQPSLRALNAIRAANSLPPTSLESIRNAFSGTAPNCHVLTTYPLSLIPPDPSWSPAKIHHALPLASAYMPSSWKPQNECPQLCAYLEQGPAPLVVTFGSMVLFDRFTTVSRNLLNAFRQANISRVLILKQDLNIGPQRLGCWDGDLKEWANDHVWVCEERAQFAWLFQHARMVMCHGGAGTTFAALRAGKPVLVAPFCLDQFFWGDIVKGGGVGACLEGCLRDLRVDDVLEGVKTCLSEEVAEKVKALSDQLNAVDAPTEAAQILSKIATGGESLTRGADSSA